MKMMKKISTMAIAAMAATMAVGSGISSYAANVVDSTGAVIADGGFYSYWDSDKDGTKEWAAAPYGMYDGNIDGDVYYDASTNTVIFTLKDGVYTTPIGEVSGSVVDITDSTGKSAIDKDGIVTMVVGEEYTLTTTSGGHTGGSTAKFIIS